MNNIKVQGTTFQWVKGNGEENVCRHCDLNVLRSENKNHQCFYESQCSMFVNKQWVEGFFKNINGGKLVVERYEENIKKEVKVKIDEKIVETNCLSRNPNKKHKSKKIEQEQKPTTATDKDSGKSKIDEMAEVYRLIMAGNSYLEVVEKTRMKHSMVREYIKVLKNQNKIDNNFRIYKQNNLDAENEPTEEFKLEIQYRIQLLKEELKESIQELETKKQAISNPSKNKQRLKKFENKEKQIRILWEKIDFLETENLYKILSRKNHDQKTSNVIQLYKVHFTNCEISYLLKTKMDFVCNVLKVFRKNTTEQQRLKYSRIDKAKEFTALKPKIIQLYQDGFSIEFIAKTLQVSNETLYDYAAIIVADGVDLSYTDKNRYRCIKKDKVISTQLYKDLIKAVQETGSADKVGQRFNVSGRAIEWVIKVKEGRNKQ